MSKIKFREYSEEDGMEYIDDLDWLEENGVHEIIDVVDQSNYREYIIPRLIGVLQKNSKEIYGGDIYKTEDGEIGQVDFCDARDHGAWVVERVEGFGAIELDFLYWNLGEVIGNIYQNPELLEEKNG